MKAKERERTVQDVVQEALKLWIEATGMDPESDVISSWSKYEDAKQIGSAQEIDDDDLTAFMVLRASARKQAGKIHHSTLELVENPDEVQAKIDAFRKLIRTVNDPVAMEEVAAFQEALRNGARVAGLGDVLDEQIANLDELANIRNDALLSRKFMSVHSFRHGVKAEGPLKYNERVLKFWNIQSVVQAAMIQPEDAISLCMVRDPEALWSYFVFLAKDGENISVWTDVERGTHPLQRFMSRSAGQTRRFMNRAFQLRFPYQLFEFEFDDKGKHFLAEGCAKNSLVPINTHGVSICDLKELPADQALWALMMFHYITDHEAPDELSYTGEGTVGDREGPGRQVLPMLTADNVTRDELASTGVSGDEDNWRSRDPTDQNLWMEERYEDQVPESIFNLVGDDIENLYLVDGSQFEPPKLLMDGRPKKDDWTGELETFSVPVEGVQPTSFGTPKEMDEDRRWLARFNKAKYIQKLADDEFEARKEEITTWYRRHVRMNDELFIEAAVRGKLIGETVGRNASGCSFDCGEAQDGMNLLIQYFCQNPPWYLETDKVLVKLFKTKDMGARRSFKRCCYLSEQVASIWTKFTPGTPKSLAQLAGCFINELPDVLQHWTRNERYTGNSILDRLDPIDGHLDNPWHKLKFEVVMALSKQTFNRLLKERGLPKRTPERFEHSPWY